MFDFYKAKSHLETDINFLPVPETVIDQLRLFGVHDVCDLLRLSRGDRLSEVFGISPSDEEKIIRAFDYFGGYSLMRTIAISI